MRQTKPYSNGITDSSPAADEASFTPSGASNAPRQPRDTNEKQALVTAAWEDMRQRQSKGQPVRAEDYMPGDRAKIDEGLAMDLIYGEYVLRTESGEIPTAEYYIERFPAFADAIRRQLDVHSRIETLPSAGSRDTTSVSDVALAGDPMPEPMPTKLGKYLLLASLSSGGQADVYRAVHPTLGRELVVKLSRKSLDEDSSIASRLLEEGRILADLDHPNLVRVYDMGLHLGHPYLAMEYVRGRTLDQYVQEESITPQGAARIVSKIAAAVSAAHDKNVLHLDIKPKNILIDERGNPRVVDFGLSRILDPFREEVGSTSISGTLQYMAPEQARGDRELIGRRTDVFGLGGVLYFMLTRKVPFPGKSPVELLPRIAKGQWETEPLQSPSIPPRLRAVCTRAMALGVDERFRSAADLAKALDRYDGLVRIRSLLAKAAALVAVLAIVLAGIYYLTPAAIDANPTLDVNVRRPNGQYVALDRTLPLQTGDELQIRGRIPAHVHAGLFLFTSAGRLEQLASWQPASEPFELQFPEAAGATAPLKGPAGTEFLIVCTDTKEPVTLKQVQGAWHSLKPLEALPDYTVAVIDSGGIRFEHHSRSLGSAVVHDDDPLVAVRQQLDPVFNELRGQFSGVAGLAFPHER